MDLARDTFCKPSLCIVVEVGGFDIRAVSPREEELEGLMPSKVTRGAVS